MAYRTGTSTGETLVGTEDADIVEGFGGNDNLDGRGGDDSIYGGAGSDFIVGGNGNDYLDGGADHDHLDGGAGNDTFVVDNPLDTVIERVDGGIDRVLSSVDYQLHLELEHLTLTGAAVSGTGNYRNNEILGNAANNILDGREGDDIIVGGAGADNLTGGLGADRLYSHAISPNVLMPRSLDTVAEADTLTGGAGADHLFAGIGDTVDGGTETDTLYINFQGAMSGVTADFRILVRTGTVTVGGATISNVEGLGSIVGSEFADFVAVGVSAIHGTVHGEGGNDHIIAAYATSNIYGGEGDDYIDARANRVTAQHYGDAGNDTMIGGFSDDVFHGGDGNDFLDGGEFVDYLSGGAGDDTYVVDVGGSYAGDPAQDRVIEGAGGGNDTVRTAVNYWLGANVENLVLTGSAAINGVGNSLNNVITGNAAANLLDGAGGNDTLQGGLGDDLFRVNSAGDVVIEFSGQGNDRVSASVSYVLAAGVHAEWLYAASVTATTAINLTGNELVNRINGNAGANVLDGGAGADVLAGYGGDDIYVVDNAGDRVVEGSGAGFDTVRASVDFSLAVASHVERLETADAASLAPINLTGNELANHLVGNAGANELNGGAGLDTLQGGIGNDTYRVDNAGDAIVELAGQGTDRVAAEVSYTLAAGVSIENLNTLSNNGTAVIHLTGNELANRVTGNAAANDLDGGAGDDTLTGLAGADRFIFSHLGGTDRIADFVSGSDRIDLSGLDADSAVAGDQAFTFIGGAAFTNAAGQLRTYVSGTSTYVAGDVNGDGTADFIVGLGSASLSSADLIL